MSIAKKSKQNNGKAVASTSKLAPKPSKLSTVLDKIASLERELSSPHAANLNGLVDLLASLNDGQPVKAQTAASHALYNVFAALVRGGRVLGRIRGQETPALQAVRKWTRERYNEYTARMAVLMNGEEQALASVALNILMSLLRTTSEYMSSLQEAHPYVFDLDLWRPIMTALLVPSSPANTNIQAEFSSRYLNYFDDIRFYFLRTAAEIARMNGQNSALHTNLMYYLENLTTMPTDEAQIDTFLAGKPKNKTVKSKKAAPPKSKKRKVAPKVDDGSTGIFDDTDDEDDGDLEAESASAPEAKPGQHDLLSLHKHRRVFSDAWIAFLQSPLPENEVKRVLVMLHRQVMPHLVEPSILIDFLADSCDYGGTLALLALNGLFTLITKHRLDYPNFYRNLYRLLDNNVLHVRYRPRFLRMLDVFLSSTHLPIALVASFIKRLARLTLAAPPAAIVSVIPFIYNLLKRHNACMVMIHLTEISEPDVVYQDPYIETELDPLKTNAIDSSLWELASLRSHYVASVSSLAKIFGEVFTKPNYDMEDFLDHSYATMFETEETRKIKKAPAMKALPTANDIKYIFPSPPPSGSQEEIDEYLLSLEGKGDIVSRLWSFS